MEPKWNHPPSRLYNRAPCIWLAARVFPVPLWFLHKRDARCWGLFCILFSSS
ncbi:hypothetical protein B0J17DRAFT_683005, partial [Rhizoctonia solani]